MSTQITEPPTTEDVQRRGHVAALAVAAAINEASPIVPDDLKTTCNNFAMDRPRVDVYFHDSAEGVEALAQVLDVQAETRPFRATDPRPYVEMSTVVAGVPVVAWSLLSTSVDDEVTA
ncbi:hypothetical protein [Streptomyces decoyicus]|uniref:hypothetical protein n=1 Tax=Streptomyces decoyicus TaxID=249567 RepID=UPI00381BB547